MNVLFSLYQHFGSNSANHVDGIARVLCALGCDCIAAVPKAPTRAELLERPPYKTATFQEVLDGAIRFEDGGGIDVAHFWTPREVMRHFRDRLREGRQFATVVHLEDNEELISRSQLRGAFDEFAVGRKTDGFPEHLSHPKYWKEFIEEADGVTVIIDSLREFVPEHKPVELIWPSTDERHFYPRKPNPALRKELGIEPGRTVLAYHGNVHSANFREVRSLYLAVALLNREGLPTTLLRTGTDHVDAGPEYRAWAGQFAREVGFVPSRSRLAEILSEADVFVQPGMCDEFNEYRFPSKVPDFLALGRPLILPRTNIGLLTRHGQDAYVLEEAGGEQIADAIKEIMGDEALRRRLAAGARKFFETYLGWPSTAVKLLGLYQQVVKQRRDCAAITPLTSDKNPHPCPLPEYMERGKEGPTEGDSMNLTKRYADTKFPALSYATVRDYCDSADHLKFLCTVNDLKDVQRPWTAKALMGELKPGGKLLEIGAGEPLVASFLQTLGWHVTVCDPYDGSGNGPTAYSHYCRKYPNVKIIRSVFDESAAEPMRGQLDAIYSISVLEHVHERNLDKAFAGIGTALRPGGLSLHCADAVVQGNGADFHIEQMARILQFQKQLAGEDADWDGCLRLIRELCAAAMADLETFYLGPQGHNQWRGATPYEEFPFRKCISVQFIARKKA